MSLSADERIRIAVRGLGASLKIVNCEAITWDNTIFSADAMDPTQPVDICFWNEHSVDDRPAEFVADKINCCVSRESGVFLIVLPANMPNASVFQHARVDANTPLSQHQDLLTTCEDAIINRVRKFCDTVTGLMRGIDFGLRHNDAEYGAIKFQNGELSRAVFVQHTMVLRTSLKGLIWNVITGINYDLFGAQIGDNLNFLGFDSPDRKRMPHFDRETALFTVSALIHENTVVADLIAVVTQRTYHPTDLFIC